MIAQNEVSLVPVNNTNNNVYREKSELEGSSLGSLTPIEEERQAQEFSGTTSPPASLEISNITHPCSLSEEHLPQIVAPQALAVFKEPIYNKSPDSECGKSSVKSEEALIIRKKSSKFHTKLLHLLHHDEDQEQVSPRTEQSAELKEKTRNILSPLFGLFVSPKPRKSSKAGEMEQAMKEGMADRQSSASMGNISKASKKEESQSTMERNQSKTSVVSASTMSKSTKSLQETKTHERRTTESSFLDKYMFCSNKIIGKGASGVVRLAKRNNSEVLFAVKEFRRKRKEESHREYIKKLTSEFCIGSMLHHMNVVETIDIIKDGDHWYEIMEYCPGGDLYSVIRDGKMGTDEIDCYFKQLVEGVAYLHSLGVAHRDLKPENLLVNEKGQLKITDFGVSEVFRVCWENKPHLSKGLCGSTPYISPEQFTGKEYDAQQVDIWACGIIYYAMTFHGIPWENATMKDPNYKFFTEHRGLQSEPLVRLPYGPRNLLYRMLEPDPAKRINVKEILEDDWFKKIAVCCYPNNGRHIVHEHNVILKHI